MNRILLLCACCLALPVAATEMDAQLRAAADTYLQQHLQVYPLNAYVSDLPLPRHDRFTENRLLRLRDFHAVQDAALLAVATMAEETLSPRGRLFRAKLLEWLSAQREARVCRKVLWDVDHIFGTHARLQQLVRFQPLGSAEAREQALIRWARAADYYDVEIENLRQGLRLGYSSPQSVVRRAIGQLESLGEYAPRQHPFYGLAERSKDTDFQARFETLLSQQLQPAMRRYTAFLKQEYLPRARRELAVTALPDGRACYMAEYRRYTTLTRTPEEVHSIGADAVAANIRAVEALGRELYKTDSFAAAVTAAQADPAGKIESREAFQAFLEALVERSRALSATVFPNMPATALVVAPLPEFQQGSGVSPHYVAGNSERPGRFVYDPSAYDQTSYSGAEILAIHEGYPGHHLQIALALESEPFHPLEKLLYNSAYVEGWARYAEGLAEELGIYQTDAALIQRRAWPARGMVLDTGLHVLGWSREQLVEYLQASGNPIFAADPDQMLDRMAIWPGQLTAYDSGALEIFRLRAQLQAARGESFSLAEFHAMMLAQGVVPLAVLNARVNALTEGSSPPR